MKSRNTNSDFNLPMCTKVQSQKKHKEILKVAK